MRMLAFAAVAIPIGGAPAFADVPVTDDVPDLTAAQVRDDERRADHGDDAAALELAWRTGPEKRPLHYLLMAARHGRCDAIEMAAEHYEAAKEWHEAARWTQGYAQAHCGYIESMRAGLWLSEHQSLVSAAMRGDCKSVAVVRRAIRSIGDARSPWLQRPDRHGC